MAQGLADAIGTFHEQFSWPAPSDTHFLVRDMQRLPPATDDARICAAMQDYAVTRSAAALRNRGTDIGMA
jgi:hypothetical protein